MSFYQELRLVTAIRYALTTENVSTTERSLTAKRILAVIQFFNLKEDGRQIDLDALVVNIVRRVNKWCFCVLLVETFVCPFLVRGLKSIGELDEISPHLLFGLCWGAFLGIVDPLLGWLLFMKWIKKERSQARNSDQGSRI